MAYYNYHEERRDKLVVVLYGSEKDMPHITKLCNNLKKLNINFEKYEASAHKNTPYLLEVLNKPYTKQKDMIKYQSPSLSNKKYQTFCGT